MVSLIIVGFIYAGVVYCNFFRYRSPKAQFTLFRFYLLCLRLLGLVIFPLPPTVLLVFVFFPFLTFFALLTPSFSVSLYILVDYCHPAPFPSDAFYRTLGFYCTLSQILLPTTCSGILRRPVGHVPFCCGLVPTLFKSQLRDCTIIWFPPVPSPAHNFFYLYLRIMPSLSRCLDPD